MHYLLHSYKLPPTNETEFLRKLCLCFSAQCQVKYSSMLLLSLNDQHLYMVQSYRKDRHKSQKPQQQVSGHNSRSHNSRSPPYGGREGTVGGHHRNGTGTSPKWERKKLFCKYFTIAYANLSANEPIGSLFVKSHLLYLLILLNPNSIVLK